MNPIQQGSFRLESRAGRRRGVSLIEMLCVIGIIGILMGMLLPVISRAYYKVRVLLGDTTPEPVGGQRISQFQEQLRAYLEKFPNAAIATVGELFSRGVISQEDVEFLASHQGVFFGVQPSDRPNKVVLQFSDRRLIYSLTKADLLTPVR